MSNFKVWGVVERLTQADTPYLSRASLLYSNGKDIYVDGFSRNDVAMKDFITGDYFREGENLKLAKLGNNEFFGIRKEPLGYFWPFSVTLKDKDLTPRTIRMNAVPLNVDATEGYKAYISGMGELARNMPRSKGIEHSYGVMHRGLDLLILAKQPEELFENALEAIGKHANTAADSKNAWDIFCAWWQMMNSVKGEYDKFPFSKFSGHRNYAPFTLPQREYEEVLSLGSQILSYHGGRKREDREPMDSIEFRINKYQEELMEAVKIILKHATWAQNVY